MLSIPHHKDTEVEELLGTYEEVVASEQTLLKLSELTQRSQKDIDFQQYIKKLLKESVDTVNQIIKDLTDLQTELQEWKGTYNLHLSSPEWSLYPGPWALDPALTLALQLEMK